MNVDDFKKSANFIAKRNVSERVDRVFASFDPNEGNLFITYCTKSEPTDDDWEDCELMCGEMIAEFPEIIHAKTDCVTVSQCSVNDDAVVFIRE